MRKAAVFGTALILWTSQAQANWEFTRWGMTIDEVVRATRYDAIRNGQGYGCLLEMQGPLDYLGIRYGRAKFCFDDNSLLESVELLTDPKSLDRVERSLNQAYGSSRLQRSGEAWLPQWVDSDNGNAFRLERGDRAAVIIKNAGQQ